METINYSEITGSFMSFMSSTPKWYLNFKDIYYSFDSGNVLRLHNSSDRANLLSKDTPDRSIIKFVINDDYQLTKVFDNVSYSADFEESNNFSRIFFSTSTQSSKDVDLIEKREDTYKFAIPRNNISDSKDIIYGRLYNWYAATNAKKIAPDGWHVATKSDWDTLISYAGGESVAGGKLKKTGTAYWQTPNTDALDQFGFSAMPGGCYSGGFFDLHTHGHYITSTFTTSLYTVKIAFNSNSTDDSSTPGPGSFFGSIRLVKDNSVNEGDIEIDGAIYNSVTIGTQVWLKQNLSTTKYQDGSTIGSNINSTDGAMLVYNNDSTIEGTVIPSRFQDRLRGKYLFCNYEFNNSNGNYFTIPFIETSYRYSKI